MKYAILLLAIACGVLSAPVEDEAMKEFIDGNHLFSSGVYKEIIKYEKGNFVTCPISAEIVLALAHEGARGKTATELVTGLNLPNTSQKTQYAFKTFLPYLARHEESIKFYSANKIFTGSRVNLETSFEEIARSVYYIDVAKVDFSKSSEAAHTINKFVESNTNGKISDLVSPGSFNEFTKLVLVNTIYFNGVWVHQFHAEDTKAKAFHQRPDVAIEVPTMSQTEHFNYYDHPTLNAQFLELPYVGGNISMIVVLPHEGCELSLLENQMEQLVQPQPFKLAKIYVELPKFKAETGIKFVPILENMGIQKAFKAGADFSGLSSTDRQVVISDVVQKTFISVDEKGTEATGATLAVGVGTSYDPSQPILFKANRPFIYYITYNGVVAFTGRVSEFV